MKVRPNRYSIDKSRRKLDKKNKICKLKTDEKRRQVLEKRKKLKKRLKNIDALAEQEAAACIEDLNKGWEPVAIVPNVSFPSIKIN